VTLLDTNTLIHYLKGMQPVVSRLQASSPRELAIPSVVAHELLFGTLKAGSLSRGAVVAQLLVALRQVPFDSDAAQEAARVRFDLESRGLVIGPLDLLIAGTALSRGATLVTNNNREFSRVRGLRLSDWSK
jgi:tRNA(fMet)-specific endonuclease VapC